MREPDAKDFRNVMEKEIIDQWDNGNFRLFNRKHVPPDKNILPDVWALRRKRDSHTGTVKKHKARWNLDGSKQVHGVDFDNTYSPTVTWPSIRLVLTLTSIHSWKTRQLDFVQAFPQADISHQQFVELPKGIEIEGVDLLRKIYLDKKSIDYFARSKIYRFLKCFRKNQFCLIIFFLRNITVSNGAS